MAFHALPTNVSRGAWNATEGVPYRRRGRTLDQVPVRSFPPGRDADTCRSNLGFVGWRAHETGPSAIESPDVFQEITA